MPADPHRPALESFLYDVREHELTIPLDHGLHRHLTARRPSDGFPHFHIVTWPGYLTIAGDMHTFTFARTPDMFTFFRGTQPNAINPSYWAEKLQDDFRRARTFDWERFEIDVWEHFDAATRALSDIARNACRRDLSRALDACEPDEPGAIALIRDFHFDEFRPRGQSWRFDDFERDGRDWDYHYIWCCRAIVWAIAKYDAAKAGV